MGTRNSPPVLDRHVDAAMAAARVFVAIVVASVDGMESLVNLRQLRALVILAEKGPMNVVTLAEHLDVHPSNATRLCDRLVQSSLVRREQSAADRRHLVLSPTTKGSNLVRQVMDKRRTAMRKVLTGMTDQDRRHLAVGLEHFAAAAGDVPSDGVWAS
jgi:DNA-binding MarR family transcriptional regulator